MSTTTAQQPINAVPAGYELSFDSTEPIWFGPAFENSWAQWDFDGFIVWASDGKEPKPLPLAEAKELHRQLTGILTAMGEIKALKAAA